MAIARVSVVLVAAWIVCSGGHAQVPVDQPDGLVLVRDGRAAFRIVVADTPAQPVQPETWAADPPVDGLALAAYDLALYVEKSTGAEPEVLVNTTRPDGLIHVHLGMTDVVKGLGLDLPKPQGFVIAFPDEKTMVIAGLPLEGHGFNTRDGVHWFLRRYLGVRWLFPGELGEHVPVNSTLVIPAKPIREEPSFLLRSASGWGNVHTGSERWEPVRWSRRMGYLSGVGLRFNHNVGNIIDPERYGDTRPDFFPLVNGRRLVPEPAMKTRKGYVHGWEPCYTAEGLAEAAAAHIVEYFDSNPESFSYSLGINDGASICECGPCRAKNAEVNRHLSENAGRAPDDPEFTITYESQTYYEWVNAVVRRVRQTYPDRYFGLLAYSRAAVPPRNVRLDDHIVPVLAWDLSYFADAGGGRQKSWDHVAAWTGAAPTFGWWDYTFEGSYFIPAYQARHVAQTLKTLHRRGLRFYFDELHPGRYYKNAPQEYMKWRLRWDIDLDPEDLLAEWFTLAVGEKAAPYMEHYFSLWEDYWNNRVTTTNWFRKRIDGDFVAPFLQRRECGYMDALHRDDLAKAGALLDKAVESAGTDRQRRRAEFFRDSFVTAEQMLILPYLEHVDMRRQPPAVKDTRTLFAYDWDQPRPGENPEYQGWGSWQRASGSATFFRDTDQGRTGKGSLCFHNEDSLPSPLAFTKNLPFDGFAPGKTYRVSGWCRTNETVPRSVRLYLQFLKADGSRLGAVPGSKGNLELDDPDVACDKDTWEERSIYFTVPEKGWEDVRTLRCVVVVTYEAAQVGRKVWLDDVAVEELVLAE